MVTATDCPSVERAGGAKGSGGPRPGALGRSAVDGEGLPLYRAGGHGAPGPSSESTRQISPDFDVFV